MENSDDDIDQELVEKMRKAACHLKNQGVSPAEAARLLRQYVGDQVEPEASVKTPRSEAN